LEGNSIEELFSEFVVFHVVDGGNGIILDSKGGNEKDGTNNKGFHF